MKRKIVMLIGIAVLAAGCLMGCGSSKTQETEKVRETTEAGKTVETENGSEKTAGSETAAAEETGKTMEAESAPPASLSALEDGVYTAELDTDSSMFHVSEACDGKGTLTVENGEMVLHVSLASKNIVNLFPGTAEEARKDNAKLLEPTTDSVTYSDGITEEVYGFDIPVPALDEEFDLALIGKKGKWYDHKVSVTNPEKAE